MQLSAPPASMTGVLAWSALLLAALLGSTEEAGATTALPSDWFIEHGSRVSWFAGSRIGATASRRPERPGSLIGQVTDGQTGEALVGATVVVVGTAIGAATDLQGRFQLRHVPEGEQVIRVTYIGYRSEEQTVIVQSGEGVEIDFQLNPDVVEGEEVVITAQAEGQVAAINRQLSSNTIVNVVSAARIQELPDANAAETVGRLPGISIKRDAGEGQKVVIRGLSPKFSSITVNGERIPATDLEDRSVDLTMLSPDMLSGVEVYKAIRPDMDADAMAGAVNFSFLTAPSEFRAFFRLQSGYNSQSEAFGQYKFSGTVSNRFVKNRLGILATGHLERADRSSDVFGAGYSLKREKVEGEERAPIAITSLDLIDRIENRNRYGGSVMLDYTLPNGHIVMNNTFGQLDRDEIRRRKEYSVSSFRTRYRLYDRDINVMMMTNSLRGEHDFSIAEVDWHVSRNSSLQKHPVSHQFRFHELAAFNDELLGDEEGPSVIQPAAKNNHDNTFLYDTAFDTKRGLERDLSARTDIRIPFVGGRHFTGYLKVGGKYRSKFRSRDDNSYLRRHDLSGDESPSDVIAAFPEREMELTTNGFVSVKNFMDPEFDAKNFLNGSYEFDALLDRENLVLLYDRVGGTYHRSVFADLADYEYREAIGAGYVMAEINLTPRLMLLPGVRFERTGMEYTAHVGVASDDDDDEGTVEDTTATNDYQHWFPMVQARYRVTDWFDVRIARTRALARPEYQFVSPFRRVSASGREVERGRPDLVPATSTNYDLFFSLHANRIGLFTIGTFLKEIENLIYLRDKVILDTEAEQVPASTRGFRLHEPVNNEHTTTVRGIEVEWQTQFMYLPSPFDGIVLNANYARIFSETQYPRALLVREEEPPFRFTQVDTFRVGRMPDQADHIANVSVGYDKRGFSGRVSVLVQGNALNIVGDRPEVDSFTETYVRWDATLKQDVARGLSLFLNLNNITNRQDASYQATAGFPTAQEDYGWTADLGVRYQF